MNWMIMPLKRFADFQGRSRRMEYWMFTLFVGILAVALTIILSIVAGGSAAEITDTMTEDEVRTAMMGSMTTTLLPLGLLWLALLIPSLAVTVRRLHDQDKSGWMVLLGLIPFVGGLIIFVFMLLPGTRGPNRFGPDPIDESAEAY